MKIKCLLSNSIETQRYHFLIYNSKNKLVLDDYTNDMGYLTFDIPYFDIYKIVLITIYGQQSLTFIPTKDSDIILFIINTPKVITIKLTDQIYEGLEIKKGKIILWQNM